MGVPVVVEAAFVGVDHLVVAQGPGDQADERPVIALRLHSEVFGPAEGQPLESAALEPGETDAAAGDPPGTYPLVERRFAGETLDIGGAARPRQGVHHAAAIRVEK